MLFEYILALDLNELRNTEFMPLMIGERGEKDEKNDLLKKSSDKSIFDNEALGLKWQNVGPTKPVLGHEASPGNKQLVPRSQSWERSSFKNYQGSDGRLHGLESIIEKYIEGPEFRQNDFEAEVILDNSSGVVS